MKRSYVIAIAAASLLMVACGDSPTAPSPTQQKPRTIGEQPTISVDRKGGLLQTLNADPCGDPTYVGPIRLPISVHGTTVYLSWLGNDGATRGYELEFQRYDVTNVWVFAMHDVVTSPEAKEFLHSQGTYRVRVRGLFCNDQVGGFTDYVVFSTDGEPSSAAPPIIIVPPPNDDPPPVVDDGNNGHGNDEDGNDESNPGNGNEGGNNCHNLTPTSKPAGGNNGNQGNDGPDNNCGGGNG